MKVHIWVHKDDVISGNISEYYLWRPQMSGHENYVQVTVTKNEFTKLEDKSAEEEDNTWGSDYWLIQQYNRNRPVDSHIKSIEELPYIYEKNSDTNEIFRRRFGDYYNKREKIKSTITERVERSLDELAEEMKAKTGKEFQDWFYGLTKNEREKLTEFFNM